MAIKIIILLFVEIFIIGLFLPALAGFAFAAPLILLALASPILTPILILIQKNSLKALGIGFICLSYSFLGLYFNLTGAFQDANIESMDIEPEAEEIAGWLRTMIDSFTLFPLLIALMFFAFGLFIMFVKTSKAEINALR